MGQQEVFNFLKNHREKWWTSKEIAKEMDASIGSVTTTLAKLRSNREIQYKMSEKRTNMYLYKFKD